MITATNILIVDDKPENLLTLDASLRRANLVILKARSGAEALETLLQHDVALAIVDVQMPEMDGFELAELMRGSERTRHVPIMFLTADAQDRDRVFRGYETGAVDFLFKPYDPAILASKVSVFVDLYRQRQELDEAVRFSELFVGILGHDLRNPLGAIKCGAHLLERGAGDEKQKVIAGRVLGSADRMARMVDEILDFTRLRIGDGIPVSLATQDLAQLTAAIVEELRIARSVEIAVEALGDLRFRCDGDRVQQVLSNLLGNAIQHGKGGGIRVILDGTKLDEVVATVLNRGSISRELLPCIFDPFRRANQTDKRDGLGLGLFITQQIVLAHGGTITVESDEETRFKVCFPREGMPTSSAPTTWRSGIAGGRSG